ncbi:MAG: efflux RND transporter periplasmic adaptor subunit [Desulfobacteraceae bacterium]|nr:MAG: efflux RND transporter periplasmic adaptor subunit [Desulfobacteraceae bacterium]
MKKRILIAVLGLVVVIGLLGGSKVLQIRRMMAQGAQFTPPPETVTVAEVAADQWETLLTAVGSLEAVQGITVTAELSGKVVQVAFEPGTKVNAGDLLVQQDTSTEEAQLRSADASAALAKVNFERIQKLLPDRVVSQSDYDRADAELKQALAQRDNIRAMIEKKTIRAPFAGRLGIRRVNLGQILNNGDPIVSLQALDPIFVNFSLPQQQLAEIREGLSVRITNDVLAAPGIEGKITAINPEVDSATRNVRLQATVSNSTERLRPGMFVNVAVVLPGKEVVLAVPATSILYAPYSNSVFVVEEGKQDQPGKTVRQQFVELGERRGDFVAVRSGVHEGEMVVSTGVFKLRNGQSVVVDNRLSPAFKLAPEPQES